MKPKLMIGKTEKGSYTVNKKKGHTYFQWATAISACLTTMAYGLESGWISPTSKILKSDLSPTGAALSETTLGWIASSMNITACCSVMLYAVIADRYGRRLSIILNVIPRTLSWILRATYTSTTTLIVARFLAGLAAGGVFNVSMYIKEISQNDIRGSLGSLSAMSINIGLLIMYILGAYFDFYTVTYIMTGLSIFIMIPMLRAPETAEFLVKQGKSDEAEKTIMYLRGLDKDDEIVKNEIDNIKKKDAHFKTLPKMSILTLLKEKYGRKMVILMFILYSCQQYNGAYVMITYAFLILESTGASSLIPSEIQSFGLPVMMIMASISLTLLIEKLGRKKLLVSAFTLTAISTAVLGSAVLIKSKGGAIPSWLPVVVLSISVMMYGGAILPIPQIMMNEMLNFQMRATIMSIAITYLWITTFISTATYPLITEAFGQYTAFYFYSAVNTFGAVFVFTCFPETKGKTEDEIYQDIMGKNKEQNNET